MNLAKQKNSSMCAICHLSILPNENQNIPLYCIYPRCTMASHLFCLAKFMIQNETQSLTIQLVPTVGPCPRCHAPLIWGDLIKRSKNVRCWNIPRTLTDASGKKSSQN